MGSEIAKRLEAAYRKVSEWPENRMSEGAVEQLGAGFIDLLELRNLVPEAAALIQSQAAEIERLTRERDEAHIVAKRLTRTLVGLTPGGSEYFTRSTALDDYFADADQCEKVIRERFDGGHRAKIDLVDERRRAEAAEQQVQKLLKLIEDNGSARLIRTALNGADHEAE